MSLAGLAATFTAGLKSLKRTTPRAMEEACRIVQLESKEVLGTYEYGWPRLAAATIKRKGKDTPLIETGEMRTTIQFTVQAGGLLGHAVGFVGSNSPKAVWHELGTPTIPPRSFLAMALKTREKEVVAHLGRSIVKSMLLPP